MKFALRSLLKSPGFTLVALLTLALGIGVNTAMYTLVDTLLFRSAPYPEADRIVRIFGTTAQSQYDGFSYSELQEMRAHCQTFEALTTLAYWNNTLAEPGRTAERIQSVDATEQFFATFRFQPFIGRAFTAEEQVPGRNQVVILGHTFWQRHFGGDRTVVGRTIRLNAEQVEIIGIMPAGFEYPLLWGEVDVWRPITIPRHIVEDQNNRFFQVVARLKPGFTARQAAAELKPLVERWAKDHPQTSAGRGIRVLSLQESTMDNEGRFYIWMLFGLSAFVLLIACANLANLQLARATANAKDLAIRSALGASRTRLVIHQLTESLLLAAAGGALGVMVAVWINDVLGRSIQLGFTATLDLHLNGPVLAVAVLVSLLSGIVFGLVPAWFASRTSIVTLLKQQTRGTTAGHHVLRSLLIICQVALALTLLGGAGVMIRGFNSFLKRDSGWDTSKVYTAIIHLPEQSTYNTEDKRRVAIDKIIQRLARMPGAEHTAVCSGTPLFGYSAGERSLNVTGQTSDDPAKQPNGGYILVASDFFSTMGIPLLEGRLFAPDIRADSPPQIVVGQTLAHQFWPNGSAIGKVIGERNGDKLVWREIIGVVRDIEFPGNPARPNTMLQIYKPLVHEPWGYLHLLARGPAPAAFAREMRQVVADIDPDVAVQDSYTIPEAIDRFQHNLFLIGQTMGWFALLGLGLAGVGLYGVISHIVAQRTGEFGIRLALGATPTDVLKLVLRRGVVLTLIGLGLGLLLASGLNWTLNSFMPRAVSADPLTLLGTATALLAVSLLACWIPARRATKVNPLDALRAE